MPIELKKPISSIAELTCENCIHYQASGNHYFCINPDSYDWDRENGDCCSNGQWFKTLSFDDNEGDVINLYGFSSLMLLFAEEKLDATQN